MTELAVTRIDKAAKSPLSGEILQPGQPNSLAKTKEPNTLAPY
jgi:hypothetical protein